MWPIDQTIDGTCSEHGRSAAAAQLAAPLAVWAVSYAAGSLEFKNADCRGWLQNARSDGLRSLLPRWNSPIVFNEMNWQIHRVGLEP